MGLVNNERTEEQAMNETLVKRCELFVENYQKMRDGFKWETNLLLPLISMIYTGENSEIDTEYIKHCKTVIRQNAGVFSSFRSTTHLVAAAMISLEENPEEFFTKVQAAYRALKDEKFHGSDYLVIAALSIAKESEPYRYGDIAVRAREFYDLMKRDHPFLTSSSDYTYAVMLALSGLDAHKVMQEAENCYRFLKIDFHSSDAVQSLAHVLSIGEEPAGDKCARVISIYDELRQRKNKFNVHTGLAALGVIALINGDVRKVAEDIIEVSEYLKTRKGFGIFSISKDQRLMLSSGLVSYDYVDAMKKNMMSMTLMNSITSILIAQHTAVVCAASSACVASAASAN
jgi:hypothetical protein